MDRNTMSRFQSSLVPRRAAACSSGSGSNPSNLLINGCPFNFERPHHLSDAYHFHKMSMIAQRCGFLLIHVSATTSYPPTHTHFRSFIRGRLLKWEPHAHNAMRSYCVTRLCNCKFRPVNSHRTVSVPSLFTSECKSLWGEPERVHRISAVDIEGECTV